MTNTFSLEKSTTSLGVTDPTPNLMCEIRKLADAGGGPSRSPRVSKGFDCGDAREPSLTVPPQRRCAVGDPGVGLLLGSAVSTVLSVCRTAHS